MAYDLLETPSGFWSRLELVAAHARKLGDCGAHGMGMGPSNYMWAGFGSHQVIISTGIRKNIMFTLQFYSGYVLEVMVMQPAGS